MDVEEIKKLYILNSEQNLQDLNKYYILNNGCKPKKEYKEFWRALNKYNKNLHKYRIKLDKPIIGNPDFDPVTWDPFTQA